MKRSFLDYYKLVLDKVSFDQQLFRKELAKAIKTIESHEIEDLFQWLNEKGYSDREYVLKPVRQQSGKLDFPVK
jgi:hypothetical protein